MNLPSNCELRSCWLTRQWTIVVVAVVLGCGGRDDGRLRVTGEVTFDGQSVPDGYVTLSPVGSGPSAGGQIKDGKFEVERAKGPSAGEYRVVIQASRETGRMVVVDPATPDHKVRETEQYLPPRYNTQSELKVTLSPENSEFKFELLSNES